PLSDFESNHAVHDFHINEGLTEFSVDGKNLGEIISLISKYDILTLETQPPTLEELFMSHYERTIQ
ncbi:MAG: ABC transporter ATP-binding protein, partial [Gallicola sp.]|nr:ABC transporter ATP-binding protein [Gallicola sp.]